MSTPHTPLRTDLRRLPAAANDHELDAGPYRLAAQTCTMVAFNMANGLTQPYVLQRKSDALGVRGYLLSFDDGRVAGFWDRETGTLWVPGKAYWRCRAAATIESVTRQLV